MPMFRHLSAAKRGALLVAAAALTGVVFFAANAVLRSDDEVIPSSVKLEIHPGDHISFIGNTLADRMQHDGWLETYLYSRYPKDSLVVRDMGFSGDELTVRLRSQGFGSPDEHLTGNKTDVVFAFFGYNESYAGAAGLPKFKTDLDYFIKHTLGEQYNGHSAPRLVIFSPIGHENLHNRNLPDGSANNKRLAIYTQAMADVAKADHVPFVDLYHPTLKLYASSAKPLTIDGVHLSPIGDEQLARVIDRGAVRRPGPRRRATRPRCKSCVKRSSTRTSTSSTTIGRSTAFRSSAAAPICRFTNGQTNRVVAQREMQVIDIMTANRDKRIWAVAQGGDLKVNDSNTPPFIPVITDFPGKNPDGSHRFRSGEQEIQTMTVAKGMKVNLFASEEEFPELANPVQMSFDTKGRLWVAAWSSYPRWKVKTPMNDKILIFEDTKGTGHADKCIVFADHLHCPTGFTFYNGGILLAQAPDVMFLKDSTGGDKCDTRIRVLDGMDSADSHHTCNSFAIDPGGAIYWQEGTFMNTQVETPWAPTLHNVNAGVYRYEPRSHKFEAYVTYGFANPHGHAWNHWGQDYIIDATGAVPYHGALFSGHLDFPEKHNHPPQLYQQRTRPCPGIGILSSAKLSPLDAGRICWWPM